MNNREDGIKRIAPDEMDEIEISKDKIYGLEFDETLINSLIVEVINKTIKEDILIHTKPPEDKIWVGSKSKETIIKIGDMFIAMETALKFAVNRGLLETPLNMN